VIDIARLVEAIASGPLPQEPFIAALPMYDWPEVRAQVDALWVEIRDALRASGIAAPEHLTRRNGDMPGVDLPPDEFDLDTLWRHPNLLLAQTCWGPMEAGLAAHVHVVGQDDYSGVEGGEGKFYSSAILMRRSSLRPLREAPPSVLSDISPSSGEITLTAVSGQSSMFGDWRRPSRSPISPLAGEMSDRTEGGASLQTLLTGQRLAYNEENSMSGYLALKRDLERRGSSLDIFSQRLVSGGHRNSLRKVASGAADVAAIDCKSWALAQEFEPAAREMEVVGWTERRLGLPFVMAGH
jgi:ABC-type phosphate/phosphonate transport system substrate-binding protein